MLYLSAFRHWPVRLSAAVDFDSCCLSKLALNLQPYAMDNRRIQCRADLAISPRLSERRLSALVHYPAPRRRRRCLPGVGRPRARLPAAAALPPRPQLDLAEPASGSKCHHLGPAMAAGRRSAGAPARPPRRRWCGSVIWEPSAAAAAAPSLLRPARAAAPDWTGRVRRLLPFV